jgi:hypothetical protein
VPAFSMAHCQSDCTTVADAAISTHFAEMLPTSFSALTDTLCIRVRVGEYCRIIPWIATSKNEKDNQLDWLHVYLNAIANLSIKLIKV